MKSHKCFLIRLRNKRGQRHLPIWMEEGQGVNPRYPTWPASGELGCGVMKPRRAHRTPRARNQSAAESHINSSPEQRVRKDHPLRPIRMMVDEFLKQLSPRCDKKYARVGRDEETCGPSLFRYKADSRPGHLHAPPVSFISLLRFRGSVGNRWRRERWRGCHVLAVHC